ncbi:MAG TPA: hypothetical protein VH700_05260 [Gemmatimonadales bacterium]|jgi:hypothetical protein
MAAPLLTRKSRYGESFLRLWKRSWALGILARFACDDSARLVTEAQSLVAQFRRSRMRLT